MVVFTFGQTFHNGFVNYDDDACVYQNPMVQKGLSAQGVEWAFTHTQVGHWDPLTTLSHMADCQLYGLWAGGHHLTNVVLHAAAAILLFLALLAMTGALWRSGFAAALFAVHPLRVESVAWVAERKDVLSGVFFMLALWAYARFVRQQSRGRFAAVMVFFLLGLMSKSMLVTLPFVLLLLDYWPLKRFGSDGEAAGCNTAWRLCEEKIPLVLLSILFSVLQMIADRDNVTPFGRMPLMQRVGNALTSYVEYLRQMLWPVDLAVLYPHPGGSLPLPEIVLAAGLLALLSVGAVAARKKQPWLTVGWLWYCGMLAPVIGIVQSGELARADRYTYLPQIGLYIAGTWAAADRIRTWRYRRVAAVVAAATVLPSLMLIAARQVLCWHDSISLWTHTLSCTQGNSIAHNNLGIVYESSGRHSDAITQYRDALQIDPAYAEAENNFGNVLVQEGRTDEAIARYRDALRDNPDYVLAHSDLGVALAREGRIEEAISEFRRSLQLDPANAGVRRNLDIALSQQARGGQALAR